MKNKIPQKSILAYFLLSFLTLGIYTLVFWHKLSKEVNVLCDGDGKKTMKYFPAWCLSIITFGIFGLIWKYKLAERLRDNAERYNLRISESGAAVLVSCILGNVALLCGPSIARALIIKNFNKIINAYNEYNGLVDPDEDKKISFFGDNEIEL